MESKQCLKCKQHLPIFDFSPAKSKSGKAGFKSYCRVCNNERAKKYYQKRKALNKIPKRPKLDKLVKDTNIRLCCKCKTLKELEQFPRNKSQSKGRGYICSECFNAYSRSKRNRTYDEYVIQNRFLILSEIKKYLEIGEKECPRCKTIKKLDFFYKSNRTFDRLSYQCKDCIKPNEHKYRSKNSEKVKERRRAKTKKSVDDLSDRYVKFLIRRTTKCPSNIVIPKELIEVKRLTVQIKRKINEKHG